MGEGWWRKIETFLSLILQCVAAHKPNTMDHELTQTINSKLTRRRCSGRPRIPRLAWSNLRLLPRRLVGKLCMIMELPSLSARIELERVNNITKETLTSCGEVTINGDELPVPSVVWDGTQNSSVETAFGLLAACECCERHQTGKPKSLSGWTEMPSRKHERPEPSFNGNGDVSCTCTCRHRMRMMARQFT